MNFTERGRKVRFSFYFLGKSTQWEKKIGLNKKGGNALSFNKKN